MGNMPLTSATAPPPVDPPHVSFLSRLKALRVAPYTGLMVFDPAANSGTLVLPMNSAPAARNRSASNPSAFGL